MRKSHYTQIGKEMDWHPLEQGVFGDARKIKIAVVGIGREAGASFVAANLAYHLAKHVDGVTYMEAENAQIAKALEGRRQACYSLGIDRALGLAGALSLDRALGLAGALSLDRALGLSSALGFVDPLGRDRPTELDHKCRPDRLPEHDRPSDAFSMRGTRGKFTDYFGLEKESLPAGSRRNLYANVNWAVRAPLEAAPLEAAPSESRRKARSHAPLGTTVSDAQQCARSHAPFNEASTDTQQGAPLRQPRLRPAASEPCMLAAPQGIGRIPGRYMIVDNPRPESLWEADVVICVVDPLPSRIRSGLQQLEALRDNQIRFGKRFSPLLNLPSPVLWVLNKDNPQVGYRELERSLNIKFDFAVPLLSPEIFYKAEYSSVPIFQMLEAAGGRPHPSGISDMQHPRLCPLAPKGADADGGSPRFHCGTSAGKTGGRGFWQTGRAPAGASAGGSSGQPRSGCAAACSEFGRLAKRVLKLLD